jgi:hypothetical protein
MQNSIFFIFSHFVTGTPRIWTPRYTERFRSVPLMFRLERFYCIHSLYGQYEINTTMPFTSNESVVLVGKKITNHCQISLLWRQCIYLENLTNMHKMTFLTLYNIDWWSSWQSEDVGICKDFPRLFVDHMRRRNYDFLHFTPGLIFNQCLKYFIEFLLKKNKKIMKFTYPDDQ